jgi:hypothetical protein
MAMFASASQGMSVYLYATATVLLFGAIALIYQYLQFGGPKVPKGLRLPPSPSGERMFSGHTHLYNGQATNNPSQSMLVKWARELGEVYQIKMGNQRWVVISSPEAVKEIFDRQGTLTSSRATNRVSMGVLSGGYRMLFMVRRVDLLNRYFEH